MLGSGRRATGAPRSGIGITRPVPPRIGVDTPAEADVDEYPPLPIVDVGMWSQWPAATALPMPGQVLPQTATVAAEPATQADAAPPSPEDGVMPVQFGIDALLSVAFGALLGLKSGRAQAGMLLTRLLTRLRPRAAMRRWLHLQAMRGLTVLRLMLGILRTW